MLCKIKNNTVAKNPSPYPKPTHSVTTTNCYSSLFYRFNTESFKFSFFQELNHSGIIYQVQYTVQSPSQNNSKTAAAVSQMYYSNSTA